MISIIVPAYNVGEYIDRCMESLVLQTYNDIEIIVINDGSTDETEEKCRQWTKKDKRIIVINKRNEGQGKARNLGIRVARGEYLTFVDADDWLEVDALERMHGAMNSSKAEVITGDIYYVNQMHEGEMYKTISKLRITPNTKIHIEDDKDLINRVRLFLCGKLYKRELFMDGDLEQSSHPFEDTAIIAKLITKAGSIYHIEKPVYNYLRNRPGSTVNNLESLKYMKTSLEEAKKYYEEQNIFTEYYAALKKLSFSQVRFICKKIRALTNQNDIKKESMVQNELFEYMDLNYPDWFNPDKYKICILGDDWLEKVVKNIVFEEDSIVSKWIDADIVIIDSKSQDVQKELTSILNCKNHVSRIILIISLAENKSYQEFKQACEDRGIKLNQFNLHILKKDISMMNENDIWNISDRILEQL